MTNRITLILLVLAVTTILTGCGKKEPGQAEIEAFAFAVVDSNIGTVNTMLAEYKNEPLVNAKTSQTNTVLISATQSCRSLVLVKTLVEHGADIDCRDWAGFTPLMLAASHSCYDIFKYLLDAGADTTLRGNDGRDLYDCARLGGDERIMELSGEALEKIGGGN